MYSEVYAFMSEKNKEIEGSLNVVLYCSTASTLILIIMIPIRNSKLMLASNLAWVVSLIPLVFLFCSLWKQCRVNQTAEDMC